MCRKLVQLMSAVAVQAVDLEGRTGATPSLFQDLERLTMACAALHLAVAEQNAVVCEQLLASGLLSVDTPDGMGRSALHWAAVLGQIRRCQLTLEAV